MLVAFEEALRKNEALWVESAKSLANQSLNAALRAARESTAALIEEAGRSNAAVLRRALQDGVQQLGKALAVSRRIAWVSIAASVLALAASVGLLLERLLH
jgi:Transcriptional activator TraM